MSDFQIVDEPYPGLRSFRRDETHIFFGRESTINEMVTRLAAHRFLAVTGTSGSGKSSLVRTGLLDALDRGLLASAGADWRVADFRPGRRPFAAVAEALLKALGLPSSEHEILRVEALLARGPLGLVEWLNETTLSPQTNLLLLADQFEEIFRFRHGQAGDDVNAFVALLLASARQRERPIFVVLTMRSDFLGDCAQFSGLAEAVNDGQYLTTRLTREQCQNAIEGPAAVFGGSVERTLVNRLLNDMATNADQLPLAQHVLMRMWRRASARTGGEARVLKLDDYIKLGGIGGTISQTGAGGELEGRAANALSAHADEILSELTPRQQRLAAILFRTLTEVSSGRDIRHPVSLSEAAGVAAVDPAELVPIINRFRAAGRNLLTPPPNMPLAPDTVIDISHESLIRQWITLRQWLREEYDAAQTYRHVETSAKLWKQGQSGLMTMPYLGIARTWRDQEAPNAAWASRYGDSFALAMEFLDKSLEAEKQRVAAEEAARQAAEEERKARLDTALRNRRTAFQLASAAGALAIVAAIAGIIAYWSYVNANEQRIYAERAEGIATEAAERARAAADRERAAAEELRLAADREKRARDEADKARTAAVYQRDRALTELARKAFVDGDYMRSMLLSVEMLSDLPEGSRSEAREPVDFLARTYHQLASQRSIVGRGRARFAAFLPDSSRIVMISGSVADVWDSSNGKHVAQYAGHIGQISEYDYSLDGKLVVTGGADGTVRLWEAASGQLKSIVFQQAAVLDVKFSKDDKLLVTAGADGVVRIIDADAGKLVEELKAFDEGRPGGRGGQADRSAQQSDRSGVARAVNTAMFSPDGSQILTVWSDEKARVLDSKSGKILKLIEKAGSDAVKWAMYTPDGSRIVLMGEFKDVEILDARDFRPITVFKATNFLGTMAISRDSKYVALSGKYEKPPVDILDAQTGKLIHTLRHVRTVDDIEFTPDSTRLVTNSDDNIARVWDVRTGKLITDVRMSSDIIKVAASRDGRTFATAMNDGVYFWDAQNGQARGQTATAGPGGKAVLDPKGRNLLWMLDKGAMTVWNVAERAPVGTLAGSGDGATSAAFSGDGKWIAAGLKDGRIGIWKADTLEQVTDLRTQANSLEFSPDGRALAASVGSSELSVQDDDGSLRRLGAEEGVFETRSIWLSPDGRRMFTTGEGSISRLWDVGTGKVIKTIQEPTGRLTTAAFHPDGARLVTISQAGAVRLLDAGSGEEVAVLLTDSRAHSFSVSRHRLAARASDGALRVWDTSNGRVVFNARTALESFYLNEGGTRLVAYQSTRFETFDIEKGRRISEIDIKSDRGIYHTFSNDGSRVVIESYADASATVWSTDTGRQVAALTKTWTDLSNMFVVVNRDGSRVVIKQTDGPSRLFDAVTGAVIAVVDETPSSSANFSADSVFAADGERMLFFPTNGAIDLWDAKAGKKLSTVHDPNSGFRPVVSFSADSSILVMTTRSPVVRVRNARTGDILTDLKGGDVTVDRFSLTRNGPRILAIAQDGTAFLWEVGREGKVPVPVQEFRQPSATAGYYLSADGQRVVTFSRGSKLVMFEAGTWKQTTTTEGKLSDRRAFSPDGAQLALIGDDNVVRILDAASGRVTASLTGHTNQVRRAIFSPDGKRVLTVSKDKTARLWDAATGKALGRPMEGHDNDVIDGHFGQGGRIVTLSRRDNDSDGTTSQVYLWPGDGSHVELGRGEKFDSILMNPAGTIVAAFSPTVIRQYDVASGNLLEAIALAAGRQGRYDFISSPLANLVSSADGSTIASERNGTVWTMTWSHKSYVDLVKAILPRCLSVEERRVLLGDPEPPDWCIELRKPPFDTARWKQWLADRTAGRHTAMPRDN